MGSDCMDGRRRERNKSDDVKADDPSIIQTHQELFTPRQPISSQLLHEFDTWAQIAWMVGGGREAKVMM